MFLNNPNIYCRTVDGWLLSLHPIPSANLLLLHHYHHQQIAAIETAMHFFFFQNTERTKKTPQRNPLFFLSAVRKLMGSFSISSSERSSVFFLLKEHRLINKNEDDKRDKAEENLLENFSLHFLHHSLHSLIALSFNHAIINLRVKQSRPIFLHIVSSQYYTQMA